MIRRVPNVALLVSAAAILFGSARASAGTAPKLVTLAADDDASIGLSQASRDRRSLSLGDDSGKRPSQGVPPSHTVQKGDTLWDICDEYFDSPWQWPRVWSYNPEILNPHWIYPGEVVKLRREGGLSASDDATSPGSATGTRPGSPLRPRTVPAGTVFLRDQGYVYDQASEDTGEIIGSPEERMFLTPGSKVYVRVTKDQADKLQVGDSLSVFQYTRTVPFGGSKEAARVVQFLGTIRVDAIDTKTKLVDGTITEALDVIERGARVGPLERRLDVVAPKTNETELRGAIISAVQPNVLFGQNQVLLVDKGEADGLAVGNRLFVVRKGDPWKAEVSSAGEMASQHVEVGAGPAVVRPAEIPPDTPDMPEEVVAEIRVVRVRKNSATCLVTSATLDIAPGDVWVAKKGY